MATVTLDQVHTHVRQGVSQQIQWRTYRALLLAGDAAALAAALAIAYFVRYETELAIFQDRIDITPFSPALGAAVLGIWLCVFWAAGLYNREHLLGGTQEYGRVFSACGAAMSLLIIGTFFDPAIRISRGWILAATGLSILLVWVERFVLRRVAYAARRRGYLTRRALIVGTDGEANAIAEQLRDTPTAGTEVAGFVATGTNVSPKIGGGARIFGSLSMLPKLVDSLGIQEIIVSTTALQRSELIRIFETYANSDRVQLRFASGLYELYTAGVHVRELGNVPLVCMNRLRLSRSDAMIKGIADRLLAVMGLFALAPLFLVIAVLIKRDSHGPAIYRRRVLGTGGHEFDAFKFRTMYVNGDALLAEKPELGKELETNHKLKQDPRVTPFGAVLRRLSLDELPQLLNVLKGEMSLVGPRMICPQEGKEYGQWLLNLLTVKPGLTGLWQVRGRCDVSYAERVRLDMYYIRNYSIWLDLQILLQTLPAVLSRRGAY